jgi:hypothetical protein
LGREFASEALQQRRYLESLARPEAANLQNSLFFSLFAGNLTAETGSTATASAAMF